MKEFLTARFRSGGTVDATFLQTFSTLSPRTKKFLTALVAIIFVTTTFATVFAAGYVGNANSRKFHVTSCQYARKMNPKNRIDFSDRDEAVKAGYVPCKRYKP